MKVQTAYKSPIVREYDVNIHDYQERFDKAEELRRRRSSLHAPRDKKTLWRKVR